MLKTDFFAKFSKKRPFHASQTVDKIENAKNNEIKIAIQPPGFRNIVTKLFSQTNSRKNVWDYEIQQKFTFHVHV